MFMFMFIMFMFIIMTWKSCVPYKITSKMLTKLLFINAENVHRLDVTILYHCGFCLLAE